MILTIVLAIGFATVLYGWLGINFLLDYFIYSVLYYFPLISLLM